MSREWGILVGAYLESRESLAGVVVLMDIRHPLTELDRTLLDWCLAADVPVLAVLTKADKLARGRRGAALSEVRGRPLPSRRPGGRDRVLGDEAESVAGALGPSGPLVRARAWSRPAGKKTPRPSEGMD